MSITGVDIAWARPTIAEIKASGASWVARYFSTDSTKDITAAEVTDYPANGLAVVVVRETTTGRATQGHQAGVDDAYAADSERASVGLPAEMPIHFAVDEDTDWASVAAYFAGAASVIGQGRVGVYGGFKVIEGAGAAGYHFLWQTVAWSGGQWSSHATIRQPGGTTLSGGADYDYAEVPDFGQYPRPNGGLVATQAEIDAIAAASATRTASELTDGPHRDTLAFAVLFWLHRALDGSIAVDTKNTTGVVQEALAIRKLLAGEAAAQKAELDAIKAAVTAATDALAKLAAAGSATTAEVQAGIQAELVKLGASLSALK